MPFTVFNFDGMPSFNQFSRPVNLILLHVYGLSWLDYLCEVIHLQDCESRRFQLQLCSIRVLDTGRSYEKWRPCK